MYNQGAPGGQQQGADFKDANVNNPYADKKKKKDDDNVTDVDYEEVK